MTQTNRTSTQNANFKCIKKHVTQNLQEGCTIYNIINTSYSTPHSPSLTLQQSPSPPSLVCCRLRTWLFSVVTIYPCCNMTGSLWLALFYVLATSTPCTNKLTNSLSHFFAIAWSVIDNDDGRYLLNFSKAPKRTIGTNQCSFNGIVCLVHKLSQKQVQIHLS